MSEPTIDEARRLVLRLNGAGTVKRLDFLHNALVQAYRVGQADALRSDPLLDLTEHEHEFELASWTPREASALS